MKAGRLYLHFRHMEDSEYRKLPSELVCATAPGLKKLNFFLLMRICSVLRKPDAGCVALQLTLPRELVQEQ